MSRFQRMIGGWLGLLAILMASLAPTISHTLALQDARDAREGVAQAHCDMPSMSMPMSASMSTSPAASEDNPPSAAASSHDHDTASRHAAMSDGDACGYCSLLAHLPVMPSVETLFVVGVLVFVHVVVVRFERVRRVEPLTFAQPRAPPLIA